MKYILLFMVVLCVGCTSARETVNMLPFIYFTDSIPDISHITEMKAVGDTVYIVYENENGYGQRFLCSYTVNQENRSLSFNGEYGNCSDDYYQLYMPYPFISISGTVEVVSQDDCELYSINSDRTFLLRKKYLLGGSSKPPYPLSQYVQDVFATASNGYMFVAREPSGGRQAVFSINTDSASVKEVKTLVADSDYPSWIVNVGEFAFSLADRRCAFAYRLFPFIEFLDTSGSIIKLVNIAESSFDPATLEMADFEELNPLHFVDLTSTDEFIYALYWGKTYTEMKIGHSQSRIYKFDWIGNIVEIFSINEPLYRITVIKGGLICWNGSEFVGVSFL